MCFPLAAADKLTGQTILAMVRVQANRPKGLDMHRISQRGHPGSDPERPLFEILEPRLCLSALASSSSVFTPGKLGNAVLFDGASNPEIDMGNPSDGHLDLGQRATIEAWVRFDSLPSNSFATLVSKDQGPGLQNKWIVAYASNYLGVSNATMFQVTDASLGTVVVHSKPWVPVVGQWYHLAVVKNGNSYTFYRDGVADGSATATVAVPHVGADLTLGQAEGGFFLHGALDDVRVWNTARTGANIQASRSSELSGSETGLVGYWPMDESSGSFVSDRTANNTKGVISALSPPRFVLPLQGAAWRDWCVFQYFDEDPSAGLHDYAGGTLTYDTHNGTDFGLLFGNQSSQSAGAPVLAAADGTVDYIYTAGPPTGQVPYPAPSDFIDIDHGQGWHTQYVHLLPGSVRVTLGQHVTAGEEVASIPSSTTYTNEHLHFGVFFNGIAVDPFSNPHLYWQQPPAYEGDVTRAVYSGVSSVDPTTYINTSSFPPAAQIFDVSGGWTPVYFWAVPIVAGSAASTSVSFIEPDGTALATYPGQFNSAVLGGYVYYFTYLPPNAPTGTWHATFTIGGSLVSDVPFTVGPQPGPATKLVFLHHPGPATAYDSHGSPVIVAVEDAQGQVVTTDNSTVTLSIAAGSGNLSGIVSARVSNGVAVFNDFWLDQAGTYSFRAADSSLTAAVSDDFTVSSSNAPPSNPSNTSPASGSTSVSKTPTLRASVYSDPDHETQLASQWVVTRVSDGRVVWDSGLDLSDTNIATVPAGKLAYNTAYSWQVRYEDISGAWSDYSSATTFTTLILPSDLAVVAAGSSIWRSAATGENANWTATIKNNGPNVQTANWTIWWYVSADTTWQSSDRAVGSQIYSDTIAAGASVTKTYSAPVPLITVAGQKYIIARVVNTGSDGNAANDASFSPTAKWFGLIAADSDDAASRNNTLATATNLGIISGTLIRTNRTLDIVSGAPDVDCYKITLTKTATASNTIRVDFNSTQGNLILRLFNTSGAVLRAAVNTGVNSQIISLSGLAAGTYFIKVLGYAGDISPAYNMTLAAPV